MCVFVIDVNWQISAAVRKTSPSAISLKRRSSRPLAANRNMTSAAAVIVCENRWVLGLLDTWRRDGVRLIADGGISPSNVFA